MARVVIIDPDPRTRRQLATLLGTSGHHIDVFSSEASALAGWGMEDPALIFVSMGPGGQLARELWGTLESLGATEVIWTGPTREPVATMLDADQGVGFLATPATAAAVQGFLGRLSGEEAGGGQPAGPSWSGPDALRAVDGNARRFPIARVLFLAHRVNATGRLSVSGGGSIAEIGLQNGRVVGWSGLPGLVARGLGAVTDGGPGDLMGQLGQHIGQGTPPDQAMEAAAVGLGLWVADRVSASGVTVRWTDAPWTASPMPLPRSIPQLLSAGLGQGRPAALVRRTYGAQRHAAVRATPPIDAPQSQWGLSPAALRLVRLTQTPQSLGDLLGSAGGESDQSWAAFDFVLQLGLVELDAAAAHPPAPEPAPASAPSGPAPQTDGAASEFHEVEALTEVLTQLQGAEPHVVLGVETAEQASVEALDQLFVKRSAEFHPDRFASKGQEVQRIAAEIFTLVTEAREALRDSDVRIELVERMRALESGKPWASSADKQKARLLHRQGMVDLRRQAWAAAWPVLQKTRETDPTEVRYVIDALQAGWRAGEVDPGAAAVELLGLSDLTRGEQAEVFALAGEMMLRAGKDEDKAYELLQKAVDRNPELTDAKRRLRLRDMRVQKEAEAAQKRSGLRGLFGGWGKKPDSE